MIDVTRLGWQDDEDEEMSDRERWRAMADSGSIALLWRLIANYETDRSVIADSDLDDEQPIAITFRGTLADIRLARNVLRCFEALK